MSATQTALTNAQLEAELQKNQKELGRVRERLQVEHRQLDAANTERNRLVDAVAQGRAKEADVLRVKGQLEEIGIRVEGLAKLIPPLEAAITELSEELGRRARLAARFAREKAFEQLQEEGGALAAVIVEKLMQLTTEEIAAFDRVRIRLGTEFRDLNGVTAADQLVALLWRQSGPHERLRDPNVHICLLEDAGWVFAGKIAVPFGGIPSAKTKGSNPMVLTLQSMMRPRD